MQIVSWITLNYKKAYFPKKLNKVYLSVIYRTFTQHAKG